MNFTAFWEITELGVTEDSFSIARDIVCKLLVLSGGGELMILVMKWHNATEYLNSTFSVFARSCSQRELCTSSLAICKMSSVDHTSVAEGQTYLS
jgi:hypothetical protein